MQPVDISLAERAGRVSYAAIAWMLGLPLPVIAIALLWGGCTKF